MSAAFASIFSTTPILVEDNFYEWKRAMKMCFLGAAFTWITDDPNAVVPAAKVTEDGQAAFFIYSRISPELQPKVYDITSGLEAWKAIHSYFKKSTIGRRVKAVEAFHAIKHDPSQPIEFYIQSIQKSRQVLAGLDITFSDVYIGDVILVGLHPSFHTVRTTILMAKNEPSLPDIIDTLIGSSASIIGIKSEPIETSFVAKSGHSSNNKPAPPSPKSELKVVSDNHPDSYMDSKGNHWCNPGCDGQCHRCGRPGHYSYMCIYDMPSHIKEYIMSQSSRPPDHANSTEVHFAAGASFGPIHSSHHSRPHSPNYFHSLSPVSSVPSSPRSSRPSSPENDSQPRFLLRI